MNFVFEKEFLFFAFLQQKYVECIQENQIFQSKKKLPHQIITIDVRQFY